MASAMEPLKLEAAVRTLNQKIHLTFVMSNNDKFVVYQFIRPPATQRDAETGSKFLPVYLASDPTGMQKSKGAELLCHKQVGGNK